MFAESLYYYRKSLENWRFVSLSMFPAVDELIGALNLVDKRIVYDFFNPSILSFLNLIADLRKEQFDAVILPFPSNSAKYDLLSFLTGAKARMGYDYQKKIFPDLSFLNTVRVIENPTISNRQHNLDTAKKFCHLVGGNSVNDQKTLDTLRDILVNKCKKNSATSQMNSLTIGFHTFSSTFKNMHLKCWPADRFAQLAVKISKSFPHARMFLFCGPNDSANIKTVQNLSGGLFQVVTHQSFIDTLGEISRCDLFISNDSGLMHAAAFLNIPTVALFGPTNHKRLFTWPGPHMVVDEPVECGPCFQYSPRPLTCHARKNYGCIRDLSVDKVFKAVKISLERLCPNSNH
ncbi:glycosyltransferase family 9 protein [Oscillatoria laete-virens NRMC-F 0139]|nr:glycosyltransferase family 9 protein [Oscillatoria laete-virens]MDL5055690.1 glycosyltransferase family 9 protein [Oscillatoria laete-virens NRMC-F 0139]